MNIGEICSRITVVAPRATPVLQAARLMREHHVGALVVIDDKERNRPVGIVTDRDMVVAVLAAGVDPETLTVADIMAEDLVKVGSRDGVFETIVMMQARGVRRVVVTDDGSRLGGIVSLDDLLEVLAEELDGLAKTIVREQRHEQQTRHPWRESAGTQPRPI